jgi:HEAT repeat protein
VPSDEATLPEGPDEALLRAGFALGDDYASLLRDSLSADRPRQRVLALRGAVRQQIVTSDDWLVALFDDDLDVRREALTLLAHQRVTDPRVTEAIIDLLEDDDALVVDAAAFALGEHVCVEAVDRLCVVAREHEDARCRESAVAALGAIGDDRARAVILGALEDKAPIRRRAIVALSNFEGLDIEAALARAGDDRDWQVRAAVDQLAREDRD